MVPRPRGGQVQPPSPGNQQTWVVSEDESHYPVRPMETQPHLPVFGGPANPVVQQYAEPARAYSRKGVGLFAAIAAVLASIIAVAALVFVLANRSGDAGNDSNSPTLGGSPPTDVRLRDNGTQIKVSWVDPAGSGVSFLVAMAHPGEQLKPVATLGPGQTSYEMSALNPALDYCFAVIAVYRNNKFATSAQACTERPVTGASPK
jgi:hypothetical protein